MSVFFVGTNNGMQFEFEADLENVVSALSYTLDANESGMRRSLFALPTTVRECVDAMCWEEESFIVKMIEIIRTGSRFAVSHGDLQFGVSSDHEQAEIAFANKEF